MLLVMACVSVILVNGIAVDKDEMHQFYDGLLAEQDENLQFYQG